MTTLSRKTIALIFLNVLLLGVGAFFWLRQSGALGPESLLAGDAGPRLQSIASLAARQLSTRPRAQWDAALREFSSAYRAEFSLYDPAGGHIAGPAFPLPAPVRERLAAHSLPAAASEIAAMCMGAGETNIAPLPDFARFALETSGPTRYWAGVHFALKDSQPARTASGTAQDKPNHPADAGTDSKPGAMPGMAHDMASHTADAKADSKPGPMRGMMGGMNPEQMQSMMSSMAGNPGMMNEMMKQMHGGDAAALPVTLLLSSTTPGGGLFARPFDWLLPLGVAMLASALLWLPFLRGITRPLGAMTTAAERIARGDFSVRVDTARRDELGRLAGALNTMSARLEEHFAGQKRFLGDVAHELTSPIARLELAHGLLDSANPAAQSAADDELRQMSALVHQLLDFSRATALQPTADLRAIPLAATCATAVSTETAASADTPPIHLEIADTLTVRADATLLIRAIGNVVRNSLRYATTAIRITATPSRGEVTLTIADTGPGVPAAALPRIFDPFFRPDEARNAASGGAGLGLAIVKSSIEACGGRVSARNTAPGFAVEFTLPA